MRRKYRYKNRSIAQNKIDELLNKWFIKFVNNIIRIKQYKNLRFIASVVSGLYCLSYSVYMVKFYNLQLNGREFLEAMATILFAPLLLSFVILASKKKFNQEIKKS